MRNNILDWTIILAGYLLLFCSCGSDEMMVDPEEMDPIVSGSVTFQIEGEDDYVIPGCTVRIDTIYAPSNSIDSTFLEWYIFEATDLFQDQPQGFNEEVFYEISVITRFVPTENFPNAPNQIPPAGPLVEPDATPNAPFYFDFVSVDFTRVAEDDEHVIFNIATSKPGWSTTIRRFENGEPTELSGTVLVEAFK